MTESKILDKLSKLKAAQHGEAALGNSAAAEAFASAINRLLLEYELSEADIPIGGIKDDPIIEQIFDPQVHEMKRSCVRIGWQESLAGVVARAHLCKLLVTAGSNFITFVGTKSHVAVAEYAYAVLARSADQMSAEARERWWKEECGGKHLESNGFRGSWLEGFIGRIAERFEEAKKKETQATGNETMALMRLSNAMTRASDYVAEKYKTKIRSASTGGQNYDGYRAGRKAADAMNIGQRGVEGSTKPQRNLKGGAA